MLSIQATLVTLMSAGIIGMVTYLVLSKFQTELKASLGDTATDNATKKMVDDYATNVYSAVDLIPIVLIVLVIVIIIAAVMFIK